MSEDPSEVSEAMLEWTIFWGYERFRGFRTYERELRKQYVSEIEEGSYASRGMGWLIAEAAGRDIAEKDVGWLFYH